jgi:phenylacetate-CoA ligase
MSLIDTIGFSLLTDRLSKARRWSPASIDKVRDKRFRRLLRLAVERSPFYREKYRDIDLARAEVSDLPTTTKAELRDNFDRVVTDPMVREQDVDQFMRDPANLGCWYLDRYAVSHTSGSQGPPLRIVQDRSAVRLVFAAMSARGSTTRPPGIIEGVRRLLAPVRVAIVTFERGFYPSGALLEFMQQIVGPFVRVERLSSLQDDLYERLNEFQPHVLVGYASVLEAMALDTGNLRLYKLRQITNSSEQLTLRARLRIEQAFNARVLDHYGLGECLLLSDGCAVGGIHINADWAIVEVVDEQNRPVPVGQTGAKVLVTNLANRVQPFIRYEVGDRVSLASSLCPCGSRLPRIEHIDGRASEMFWVDADNGRKKFLTGVLFHVAIDALGTVREWQARQVSPRRIELSLELLSGVDRQQVESSRRLLSSLHEFGLPPNVQVDVQIVKSIQQDAKSGKMRRMIAAEGAQYV